jgi:hypothetical protein
LAWIVLAAVINGCLSMSFKNRARMRISITLVAILAICGSIWFFAGENRWDALVTLATLAAVITAIFLDEIRMFYHRPEIDVDVGDDLIDRTSFANLLWIRGKIKNVGDRGAERCRLKILGVQGHNVQAGRIENGFLQWQGAIRDSMRLNPDESWIFDIGSRARQQNSPVNLLAYFVGEDLLAVELPPGSYRLVIAVYGDNLPSKQQPISLTIGAAPDDIQLSCI